MKVIKPKSCKSCKTKFTPARPLQKACSPLCALKIARQINEKKAKTAALVDRRETKAKLTELDSLSVFAKAAEKEVNRYVRLRDAADGCISCDKSASWDGQWHASHFRSVGAASGLRFNLWNIHKACSVCNNHLSGNIRAYTPRLLAKIGQEKFDWLQSQNAVVKRDRPYLERLKLVFLKKANRLKKRLK